MNSCINSNVDHSTDTSTADNVDEEEQEDSSSSSSEKLRDNVEKVLLNFRETWKKEIKVSSKRQEKTKYLKSPVETHLKSTEKDANEEKVFCQAKELFLKGIEMEKSGKLYEAIQFYRRAVQLVPDIEFRLDEKSKNKIRDVSDSEDDNEENRNIPDKMESDIDNDDDEIKGDLYIHIQKKIGNMITICSPKTEQQSPHISCLPTEIMLYILKWVVSSELDMRSLEMCSRVCRGFFLCARDPEIWRLACIRTWGLNCGGLSSMSYTSWRQMYVERARLNFNGCYISKTTYIRHGENSFQDQYYRPWHMVTYYRYFRFFPEGLVLTMTTADEPAQSVSLLKYRKPRNMSVLSGHYRLKDDQVLIVVHHQTSPIKVKRGRREFIQPDGIAEQTSRMQFQIKDHKKQRHSQLIWNNYNVYTRRGNGNESNYVIELVNNRFPPLWFSRVKSYTSEAEGPLM